MVQVIRITKEQHSSGISCRLQDLQWEDSNSIVSSLFVFRYKIIPRIQNFGRSYDSYKG